MRKQFLVTVDLDSDHAPHMALEDKMTSIIRSLKDNINNVTMYEEDIIYVDWDSPVTCSISVQVKEVE